MPDENENLKNALAAHRAKKPLEAERWYKAALKAEPEHAKALEGLGVLYESLGRYPESVALAEAGLRAHRASLDLLYLLVRNRRRAKRYVELVGEIERFLEAAPTCAAAWSLLADALVVQERIELFERAEEAVRRAVELEPENVVHAANMGRARMLARDMDGAVKEFERAIKLDPSHVLAHGLLGMALLTRGDYSRGLEEWSWHYQRVKRMKGPQERALWDGKEPQGKTILVFADQGQGDTIHFIRYGKLLAERGARVIAQCQPALKRLLVGCDFLTGVRAIGEPVPAHDVQTPVSFLAQLLHTTLETIPAQVPYVRGESRQVEAWRKKVHGLGEGLKVGLAWHGSPQFQTDYLRSVKLAALAPLFDVPGVRMISLQKGLGSEEVAAGPGPLADWTEQLKDFADTAALISNLDLVISVDTAVAHLAGALAKKVWIMLPYAPDWRWMLEREDSPWYPTARLWRQREPGDWAGVVERIRDGLRDEVQGA